MSTRNNPLAQFTKRTRLIQPLDRLERLIFLTRNRILPESAENSSVHESLPDSPVSAVASEENDSDDQVDSLRMRSNIRSLDDLLSTIDSTIPAKNEQTTKH